MTKYSNVATVSRSGQPSATARRSVVQPSRVATRVAYKTMRGAMYRGFAEDVLRSTQVKKYRGKVQLILTSPPFPLNRKKKYGNRQGDEYVEWLAAFAPLFREFLTENGSIVVEMGNAWEPGEPTMSTLALEALLSFLRTGDLKLCQQFICYNPARLPTPAQWVNVDRIRLKDSYTHVWWMASWWFSKTEWPKANVSNVLTEYSARMRKLLEDPEGFYSAKKRPSGHDISMAFGTDNGGAIPSNVLTFSNTLSNDPYLSYCKERSLTVHPARMPIGLAAFFIKFLTVPRNLVLDPFAGSNITGAAAESLKRRWVAIEPNDDYVQGSRGRFSRRFTR